MALGEFLTEALDLGDQLRAFLPDSPFQFVISLEEF
jgi:hypothetical protein